MELYKHIITELGNLLMANEGFINHHNVFLHFNGDTLSVEYLAKPPGNWNVMKLCLEPMDIYDFFEFYDIRSVEMLFGLDKNRLWKEYHTGLAYLHVVAGDGDEVELEFRLRGSKTSVRDVDTREVTVIGGHIRTYAAALRYTLAYSRQC